MEKTVIIKIRIVNNFDASVYLQDCITEAINEAFPMEIDLIEVEDVTIL